MKKEEFDPEVYEFYKEAIEGRGFAASFDDIDIQKLREAEIKGHLAHLDPYDVLEKHDVTVERDGAEPLWLRIYVPEAAKDARQDAQNAMDLIRIEEQDPSRLIGQDTKEAEIKGLPVILYFHGGGFIMGSIIDHDPLCGMLADECGAVVIACEYRLAPESPFPACIEDAVFTAEWAAAHAAEFGGDPSRLIAAGDSSGANISAALALLGRDKKAPELSGLILFYGTYGCIPYDESESVRLYGNGEYVLTRESMEAMMGLYVPEGTDTDDPRLNPGRAKDLKNMPPAIIVTAGLDPLRDDGEEFARRLEEGGCEVHRIRMEGMMHGFIVYWQRFSRAKKMLEDIGKIVRGEKQ